MAHDYRALAERVYDIFQRGAVDELPDLFAPDFVEHEEMQGVPGATGIELVTDWVRQSSAALTDLTYTIESVVGAGDEAAVRVRLSGTHTGELFGVPATGAAIDVRIIDWVTLGPDGRVTAHWGAMEEGKLMAQLGVAPPAQIDLTTPAEQRA